MGSANIQRVERILVRVVAAHHRHPCFSRRRQLLLVTGLGRSRAAYAAHTAAAAAKVHAAIQRGMFGLSANAASSDASSAALAGAPSAPTPLIPPPSPVPPGATVVGCSDPPGEVGATLPPPTAVVTGGVDVTLPLPPKPSPPPGVVGGAFWCPRAKGGRTTVESVGRNAVGGDTWARNERHRPGSIRSTTSGETSAPSITSEIGAPPGPSKTAVCCFAVASAGRSQRVP
mmetsp:Transcript_31588/g.97593  ORF Transcript_31588/g.97593 Transcript_31588/m.97593 type:complete len:230 (+) Transcript_31588:191-880(+)